MGMGVQFLPVEPVGSVPPVLIAISVYILGGLQIIGAFAPRADPTNFHRVLMNVGVVILFFGTIMLYLPFFESFGNYVFPPWLIAYGFLAVLIGFILMEISTIKFHKNTSQSASRGKNMNKIKVWWIKIREKAERGGTILLICGLVFLAISFGLVFIPNYDALWLV